MTVWAVWHNAHLETYLLGLYFTQARARGKMLEWVKNENTNIARIQRKWAEQGREYSVTLYEKINADDWESELDSVSVREVEVKE